MRKLKEAVDWLYGLWLKSLSDKEVEVNYVEAGTEFGDAISYSYMGKCKGFEEMFANWAKWELEYSVRGYKTISIDDFIGYGGYKKLFNGLGTKRKPGDKIILYADIYRKNFLNG